MWAKHPKLGQIHDPINCAQCFRGPGGADASGFPEDPDAKAIAAHDEDMLSIAKHGGHTLEGVDQSMDRAVVDDPALFVASMDQAWEAKDGKAIADLHRAIWGDPNFDRGKLHMRRYVDATGYGDYVWSNPMPVSRAEVMGDKGATAAGIAEIAQETPLLQAEMGMLSDFLDTFHTSRAVRDPSRPWHTQDVLFWSDSQYVKDEFELRESKQGKQSEGKLLLSVTGFRDKGGALLELDIHDFRQSEEVSESPIAIKLTESGFEARFAGKNYGLPETDPRHPSHWDAARMKRFISETILPLLGRNADGSLNNEVDPGSSA